MGDASSQVPPVIAIDTVRALPLVNTSIGCDAGATDARDVVEGQRDNAGGQRGERVTDLKGYRYRMYRRCGRRRTDDNRYLCNFHLRQTGFGLMNTFNEATGCAGSR